MNVNMKTKILRPAVVGLLVASMTAMAVLGQQPSQLLGKTDLRAWIDGAPGLPNNLEEAAQRRDAGVAGRSYYQPFYDRVETFKKSYNQAIADKAKPDQAAVRQAAEAQANSNRTQVNALPAIAQMGGIDVLARMSPAERAQAAQLMAQNMQQNPALLTGNASPGMQALMKKIMSDPGY